MSSKAHILARHFSFGVILIFPILAILGEGVARLPLPPSLQTWRFATSYFLVSEEYQCWVLGLLTLQLLGLVWLRLSIGPQVGERGSRLRGIILNPDWPPMFLLLVLAGWSLVEVSAGYAKACEPANALTFHVGLVLCAYAMIAFRNTHYSRLVWAGLFCLGLTALLGLTNWEFYPDRYKYLGVARWNGLWDSPNTFGLLMAVMFVASVTALSAEIGRRFIRERGGAACRLGWLVGFEFFSVILSLVGLVGSYSRGAWVGAILGLFVVVWCRRKARPDFLSLTGPNAARWMPFALVMASAVVVIAIWHYQSTDARFVRRVYSITNPNDFSWRYRLGAWEGALQMMADHPFGGVGWNHVDRIYIEYYQSPQIVESGAIETNDIFMLGGTLGLLGLAAFAILVGTRCRVEMSHDQSSSWWGAGRLACLSVLFTGIFLDGILFKLSPASLFWILLGLQPQTFAQPLQFKSPQDATRLSPPDLQPNIGLTGPACSPRRRATDQN